MHGYAASNSIALIAGTACSCTVGQQPGNMHGHCTACVRVNCEDPSDPHPDFDGSSGSPASTQSTVQDFVEFMGSFLEKATEPLPEPQAATEHATEQVVERFPGDAYLPRCSGGTFASMATSSTDGSIESISPPSPVENGYWCQSSVSHQFVEFMGSFLEKATEPFPDPQAADCSLSEHATEQVGNQFPSDTIPEQFPTTEQVVSAFLDQEIEDQCSNCRCTEHRAAEKTEDQPKPPCVLDLCALKVICTH